MSDPGEISEKQLAEILGLPRAELQHARERLTKHGHWRQEGRLIVYTPAGEKALRAELARSAESNTPGNAAAAATEPLQAPVTPGPGPRRATLTCTRTFRTNERILEAVIPGEPGALRVRVRTNRNFRAGMAFRAVHLDGSLWALDQDLPRSPRDNRFRAKTTPPTL